MSETFRQWLCRQFCPVRDDPVAPPEVREATHENKNAAANMQGAAMRLKKETETFIKAVDQFVAIMHGERQR